MLRCGRRAGRSVNRGSIAEPVTVGMLGVVCPRRFG